MLLELIMAAVTVPATTYGHGELMCGDPGKAIPCAYGALTASGVVFDPARSHVAIHAPKNFRLRKGYRVCLLHKDGSEVWLPLTDKKGRSGFDLSPRAVEKLGYTPTKHWSAPVQLCDTPYKREAI